MRYKSKFKFFVFLVIGILIINIFMGVFVLRNTANSKNEAITSPKSSGTYIIYTTTPYGGMISIGNDRNENDYFEWSISTSYGPGLTFYMMNATQLSDCLVLPRTSRTRGSFTYTALLSDEESSASGTFYPTYSDIWWFVAINHYTGIACSVDTVDEWYDDFITVEEPTSSRTWEANTSHYLNWTWGGDFAYVDIDLFHEGNFLRNIATNTQNNGSYLWRIPTDISLFDDLYQVNISNTDFDGTWGISDSYFEIVGEPTINVTRPSTSNSWETGTIHFINWTSSGSITDVKIELFKDDIFELEIISSTPDDGEYSWAIPSGLSDSTQYQIKLTDVSNSSIYDYSEYFEIYVPDSITVLSPDSVSSWETGTVHSITWTSLGSITDVKIELFKDDVFELEIISSTLNDGDFSWAIPSGLDDSSQYQIKLIDVSNALTFNFSEYFEIYTVDTITVLSPNSLSSWETGTTHSITWTSTGSIADVKIELYNGIILELEIISSTPNDGEFSWVIPSGLDDSSQYLVKLTDVSNALTFNFSEYFEIYTVDTITVLSPNSLSSWETGTTHAITWTSIGSITDVKIELFKDDAFELEIISSTPNDGEYSWAIPSGLANSTQYQIKVTDVSSSLTFNFSEYYEIFTSPSPTLIPEIPGYDLILLFGTSGIGLCGIMLSIFCKKKQERIA